jgi:TolB-like protein/Tfp pilus assembly protein PilF
MQPEILNGQAARRELERVLASAGFSRNERLSRFLRFLVERQLEGRSNELKESLIAIEVFGRKPDYDPKQDAIVRTEAVRLRARLDRYYAGEGRRDPLIIELPKGGYTPLFHHPERTGTDRPRLAIVLAGVAVSMALAIIGWWWVRHHNSPIAIAVLPLENLGHDPANDDFADGLTDELIRNLSVIEGLAVRSQTSSFALKGKPRNVQEAGKQLHADYILEGSVLRFAKQLRINAQLVRVRDDFPVWAGRFDRELTDVFAIQDEISRAIVNHLRLNLGRGRRRYETSLEAYDLYLRARAMNRRRGMVGRIESIRLFEQAAAQDPSFAPAWAGLGGAYAIRSTQFELDHPADELVKMRAAAGKATQLDPLLPEAHGALALAQARDGQWEQAEKSFRRAIELDSNDSRAHGDYAVWFLLVLGRHREALQQVKMIAGNDPLSPEAARITAVVLEAMGRFDEAADQCLKMGADDPIKPWVLSRARLGQGRTAEAIQLIENARSSAAYGWEANGILGAAYARSGRREEAEKMAAADSTRPDEKVEIFAGLGDKDRTFAALDRMTVLGAQRIGRFLNYPELAFLRGDPRLKALRMKVGLPE